MNRVQILEELNIQLQIVRMNRGFWGDLVLRVKANRRIDVLIDELQSNNDKTN